MFMEFVITVIQFLVSVFIGTQLAYGIVVFFLGNTIMYFYDLCMFDPPEKGYQKVSNAFFNSLVGIGPIFYIYLEKKGYNWIVRKLLYFVFISVFALVTIIIISLMFD